MLLRPMSSCRFNLTSGFYDIYSLLKEKPKAVKDLKYPYKYCSHFINNLSVSGKPLEHNFQPNFSHSFVGFIERRKPKSSRPLSVKAARLLLLGNSMSKLKVATLQNCNALRLLALKHRGAGEWLLNRIRSIAALLQGCLTSLTYIIAGIRAQGRKKR